MMVFNTSRTLQYTVPDPPSKKFYVQQFSHNVLGMRQSLQSAELQGCYPNFAANSTVVISIFFLSYALHAKTYIFNVVEQVGSKWLMPKALKSGHAHQYLQVMRNAIQLWYMSKYTLQKTIERYPELGRKSYYVPTRAYATPIFNCGVGEITPIPGAVALLHKLNQSYRCTYSSVCGQWLPFAKKKFHGRKRSELCTQGKSPCDDLPNLQVIHYGSIDKARAELCRDMYNTIKGAACVSHTFGSSLNYLVCRAKVVVIEHRFALSALVTHRIDPLLIAGKLVVSTHSADKDMDEEYSHLITFSEKAELIRTILHVLQNASLVANAKNQIPSKFQAMIRLARANYLCNALRNVPRDLKTSEH